MPCELFPLRVPHRAVAQRCVHEHKRVSFACSLVVYVRVVYGGIALSSVMLSFHRNLLFCKLVRTCVPLHLAIICSIISERAVPSGEAANLRQRPTRSCRLDPGPVRARGHLLQFYGMVHACRSYCPTPRDKGVQL